MAVPEVVLSQIAVQKLLGAVRVDAGHAAHDRDVELAFIRVQAAMFSHKGHKGHTELTKGFLTRAQRAKKPSLRPLCARRALRLILFTMGIAAAAMPPRNDNSCEGFRLLVWPPTPTPLPQGEGEDTVSFRVIRVRVAQRTGACDPC